MKKFYVKGLECQEFEVQGEDSKRVYGCGDESYIAANKKDVFETIEDAKLALQRNALPKLSELATKIEELEAEHKQLRTAWFYR